MSYGDDPKPQKTVYSWYYPEVRAVVKKALELNNDYETRENIHELLGQNLDPGLDDLHLPLIEKWIRFARSEGVIGLEQFEHAYFTNGSSEGIFHWLAQYATDVTEGILSEGESLPLYQFEGEYQGYSEFAKSLGLSIENVKRRDNLSIGKRPGIFIISNPSAIDGNICTRLVDRVIAAGHKVVLDLAYVGMTLKPMNLNVNNPDVLAVFGSMSKPFGLYYFRIGFAFTNRPIDSLYANKWFKNILSIKVGEAVLDNVNIHEVKERYSPRGIMMRQAASNLIDNGIVEKVQEGTTGGANWFLKPSDVWLLSYAKGERFANNEFSRGEGMRVCLTDYFQHGRGVGHV